MSLADRLDPDVRAALKPYFDFFGPGGMNAIADISERRARYAELLAAAKAAQPPNPRVGTTDVHAPGLDGGPDVLITISMFDSADEAFASNERAADWVRNHVLEFTKGMPEVMIGNALIAEEK